MINNDLTDTISAIATVIGTGGVSIIRLSGENSQEIIEKIFFKNKKFDKIDFTANSITHGYIFDNKTLLDEVIVLYFKAPNSYTGENVFEIQCHGGVNITKAIFDLTLKNGARIAQRGEFTKRAFINGKLDLSQAEAVLDIISAKTEKFAKLSANNLCGKLAEKINILRDEVITILSHIGAAIDFPEEVEEPDYDNVIKELEKIIKEIDVILRGAKNSNLMRQGLKIAIVGKPNVGKSSLFNSLLHYERAIVTDIAGTTRDIISENIDINGIPATLIDTAGIREIANEDDAQKVENIGIEYSKRSIEEADIVIFVTDLSRKITQEDKDIYDLVQNKKHLIIGTKSDLEEKNKNFKLNLKVSNKTQIGIEKLIELLGEFLVIEHNSEETEFLTNARQQESLENSKNALCNAILGLQNRVEQDFIAIDIKSALMHLGEITGDDITQEILNNIFETFCIGK